MALPDSELIFLKSGSADKMTFDTRCQECRCPRKGLQGLDPYTASTASSQRDATDLFDPKTSRFGHD